LQLFGVDLALGLQPHGAPHLLEADWNGAVDQQTTAHVAFGFDLDLERLEPNTQMISEHSQGRVEAGGKRGGQQIARIGVIVVATDGAVYAETQRRAVAVSGNDGTVKRIPAARVDRLCAVADPGLARDATVPVA
jgi:hypothetical protein